LQSTSTDAGTSFTVKALFANAESSIRRNLEATFNVTDASDPASERFALANIETDEEIYIWPASDRHKKSGLKVLIPPSCTIILRKNNGYNHHGEAL
jgi:hypothetical protein